MPLAPTTLHKETPAPPAPPAPKIVKQEFSGPLSVFHYSDGSVRITFTISDPVMISRLRSKAPGGDLSKLLWDDTIRPNLSSIAY